MDGERAQLSSVATALDTMVDRIDEAAARMRDEARDDLAADLFEVQRSLEAARRRLDKVLRHLR